MKTIIISAILILVVLSITGVVINMTGNATKDDTSNKVLIKTNKGDIVVELYPDKAPITVANFKTYVKEGAYDGTVFHRVIPTFMIQGGGYTPAGIEKPTHSPIKLESGNGLKNEIGTLAMARTNVPDSATNQFFINTNDNVFLNKGSRDDGYAVFGKVTEGMNIVYSIEKTQTGIKYGASDWPKTDIIIEKVEFI